jgi:DNA-binding MarR family transcriptional regulator
MLAGILQASKPTLTSLIDNLERENLVERLRDSSDRRVYSIALTRAGKKKLAELSSIYDEVVSYIAENIAQSEMSALLHTLDLMKTKLREMNENISKEDE